MQSWFKGGKVLIIGREAVNFQAGEVRWKGI